jgi:hypothetical protein
MKEMRIREAVRTKQEFIYPKEFIEKFKKYIEIENADV